MTLPSTSATTSLSSLQCMHLLSRIALGKALQTLPLHSEHTLTKRLSAFPALRVRESLRKLSVGRTVNLKVVNLVDKSHRSR